MKWLMQQQSTSRASLWLPRLHRQKLGKFMLIHARNNINLGYFVPFPAVRMGGNTEIRRWFLHNPQYDDSSSIYDTMFVLNFVSVVSHKEEVVDPKL
jgi:hypothetical protein